LENSLKNRDADDRLNQDHREQCGLFGSLKTREYRSVRGMMERKAFTLIELLVVIAIIAILAAIIFPVFARVKDSAYRSSDMSNLNSIRTAIQLYRQDQGGYPSQLLGYATQYSGGPNPIAGDTLPANQIAGALFPKRVNSLETLRPAYDRIPAGGQFTQITTAVWPNKVDGSTSTTPDMFQKYGTDTGVQRCFNPGNGGTPSTVSNWYYSISGYDVALVPWEPGSGQTGMRAEIHYSPFWSAFTVATDPCNPTTSEMGSASDDPRQLGYSDPPGTTVVTWDSNFRDYDGGAVQHTNKDLVLFLEGNTKNYDSFLVSTQSWKIAAP